MEVRAPFVDYRIAEYVSALPDALRVRGLSTKWILRQAARQPRSVVPAGTAQARLSGAGRRLAARRAARAALDHLRGPASITRSYYEPAVLDRVLDEHLKFKHHHDKLLWTLLNLEIWHRTYLRG